ncbi:MAG: alpha/beta fold hydrolase [Oscillospiraceae bacterium]|nr:alpha/beta fold hydrolase [Oscillospiraceae bacterium]
MKKKIALLLSIIMMLSMSVPVNAATDEENTRSMAISSNDLVLLIPGTMGSELKYGSTKVWDPSYNVLKHNDYFNWLSFNELGTPNYSISVYNDDDSGAQDKYAEMFDALDTAFGNTATVDFFAYDWRKSCVDAADELSDYLDNYSGNIYLVAHSMGGLVASQYLKNASASERARTTLITIGTPFTGAPKAVNVFENGAMFGGLVNIAIGGYIKENAQNYPSAYELLPSSRHSNYLMKEEVLQGYSSALTFLKSRDWGRTESGSVKTMFASAATFTSGLGSGTSHKAYLAANTYHIVATGEDTVQKINYVLDGGEYRTDYLQMSNAGDGTVMAESARNDFAASNSYVRELDNVGDHVTMLNNNEVQTLVISLINGTNASSANSRTSISADDTVRTVNERGWIVGQSIDNRRIIININHGGMGSLMLNTGEPVFVDGETLYYSDADNQQIKVGSIFKTGVGYQYVLKNNSYILECDEADDSSKVTIRYMDDGYHEKVVEYGDLPDTEITISMSDYDNMSVQAFSESDAIKNAGATAIPVSKEYSPAEIDILNAQ